MSSFNKDQWKQLKNISRRDRIATVALVVATCKANNLDIKEVMEEATAIVAELNEE
tara:strand:- start:90 stop:257 length:168 start_codon:yes stop_codon:yes gene_type:complete